MNVGGDGVAALTRLQQMQLRCDAEALDIEVASTAMIVPEPVAKVDLLQSVMWIEAVRNFLIRRNTVTMLPECTLSEKGNVVMVCWPSTQTTPILIAWMANTRN